MWTQPADVKWWFNKLAEGHKREKDTQEYLMGFYNDAKAKELVARQLNACMFGDLLGDIPTKEK